jgi:competence/damage-inducible protein CinA-like protein
VVADVRRSRLRGATVSVRAELVSVGTELLLGQIEDTNARWISEQLAAIGVDVLRRQTVGDNLDRIVEVIGQAAARADVVLVTGGLGPTQDDLTRDAIARVAGLELERHPEIEEMLREKFRGFSARPMPLNNLRQADVPAGARTITPERGTAPGLILELPSRTRIYAMPGVPDEMVEMMTGTILPELASRAGDGVIASRVLRIAGMGESAVGERLTDLFDGSTNPTVAYLASMGEVKVRLTAKAATTSAANDLLQPVVDEVVARIGDVIFSKEDESLEATVLRLLSRDGLTIAVAESLTGGSVSARLASVAGASAAFAGAVVAYTATAKRDVLGVSQETLDGPGPVSEASALEMAAGARRVLDADVGLSTTGVAGPEPHAGHEPGTVWVALDTGSRSHARGFHVAGERDRVIRWSQQAALDLVRRFLEGRSLPVSDLTV